MSGVARVRSATNRLSCDSAIVLSKNDRSRAHCPVPGTEADGSSNRWFCGTVLKCDRPFLFRLALSFPTGPFFSDWPVFSDWPERIRVVWSRMTRMGEEKMKDMMAQNTAPSPSGLMFPKRFWMFTCTPKDCGRGLQTIARATLC